MAGASAPPPPPPLHAHAALRCGTPLTHTRAAAKSPGSWRTRCSCCTCGRRAPGCVTAGGKRAPRPLLESIHGTHHTQWWSILSTHRSKEPGPPGRRVRTTAALPLPLPLPLPVVPMSRGLVCLAHARVAAPRPPPAGVGGGRGPPARSAPSSSLLLVGWIWRGPCAAVRLPPAPAAAAGRLHAVAAIPSGSRVSQGASRRSREGLT